MQEPVKGEVIFHNVRFSYKPGLEILHKIDFETRAGEVVALVGPTGAGKTTIVSLIPRFYDIEGGAVLIDGVDIRKYRLKSLRESIGIVMQEPFLFNGSIVENIAYGRLSATMDEIVEAAKLANAHNFISALPDSYTHQIGERGVRLSVGEKQRIAIARAILKNPPILILDEATSSVDNETEALIQEAIARLLHNRTSFVIAHRLSTVMHANKILVVNQGTIAETGTHDELLTKGGIYANLYEIQWRNRQ
jgi:ABC-type multidrug transport system fused ATPase/permease subunit